jgi:hypothetical protein
MLLLLFSFVVLNATTSEVVTASQSSYGLRSSVIGAVGSPGSSAGLHTNGTLGQSTAIGVGSAADKMAYLGFWGRLWIPTSVEENPAPVVNRLYQNFPNPFNPSTTIEYSLAEEGLVEVTIFNVTGELIRMLVRESKPPGNYRAKWNGMNERGSAVGSGIYFYRLRVGSFVETRKMILLR